MKVLRSIRKFAGFIYREVAGNGPGGWIGRLVMGAWAIVLVDAWLGSLTAVLFLAGATALSLVVSVLAWRRG